MSRNYRVIFPKRKFLFSFTILAIRALQRCVIWRWNGNFAGFIVIFLKIEKNYLMKRNLHISGEWQNQQISQLLGIDRF